MDDEDLYDEFGNLIGDPLDSDAESESSYEIDEDVEEAEELERDEAEPSKDGKELTILTNTYAPNVETIVIKPDTEDLDEPVIKPKVEKKLKVELGRNGLDGNGLEVDRNGTDATIGSNDLDGFSPSVNYSRNYMYQLMTESPDRIRNVSIMGNFHSGKTTFIDKLVLDTHSITLSKNLKNFKPLRFMDNHKLEIERGITIKSSPITLLLEDLKSRSHILNIIDTPGHTNFSDESSATLNGVDGVILCIDAVEGLTFRDRGIISDVLHKKLPIVVLLNKIDRLILELKLSVDDFYHKIKSILDEINEYIQHNEFNSNHGMISPEFNNVIFASSSLQFNFTLQSFTKLYLEKNEIISIDPTEFARRLWGDIYYDDQRNTFTKISKNFSRSFISFVLEPLYKIFTYTITSDEKLPKLLWNNFGITLQKDLYKQDAQILLKDVFARVFGGSEGFVDAVEKSIPLPQKNSNSTETTETTETKETLEPSAYIIKLLESADAQHFYSLVRVFHGSLAVGSKVKIIGENFNEDSDDFRIETIQEIFLPGGRYKIPINIAPEGSIVIISGIDSIITKSGFIFPEHAPNEDITVEHRKYSQNSVFKVAIEPAKPSDLPKLLEGLRKVNKSYLASSINVEESGEHVILAPGELYMDCILHDLRLFFTDDLEIKVSDPMTKFSETCSDTSITKISTDSQSGHNLISIIAEPIEDQRLGKAIESKALNLSQPVKTTAKILRTEFGWDALAARSVWYFGPEDLISPNILLDDTLESETEKKLLYSVKDSISLGFRWSVNEGPLCDEPIRNTKFKILDAVISGSEIQRSGTQIIPMTRRACYTGFLTASPRLMEPIYIADMTCTLKAISVIGKLLLRRRGYLTDQKPIPGTQLYQLQGMVPVIESRGLETDIRLHTQGQAMCFLLFNNWEVVPGDPLDTECELPNLKPVPTKSLARDFVLKTRRRKGLTGEPNLLKYVEAEVYQKLKDSGIVR